MVAFLMVTGFILACIGVLTVRYSLTEDDGILQFLGFLLTGVVFLMFGLSSSRIGEEQGAYKQLRGEYEITYVIDKDSCVIDTIIHIE